MISYSDIHSLFVCIYVFSNLVQGWFTWMRINVEKRRKVTSDVKLVWERWYLQFHRLTQRLARVLCYWKTWRRAGNFSEVQMAISANSEMWWYRLFADIHSGSNPRGYSETCERLSAESMDLMVNCLLLILLFSFLLFSDSSSKFSSSSSSSCF